MTPEKNSLSAELAAAIDATFGSFEEFQAAFTAAATTRLVLAAWLVVNKEGKLEVTSTANQDTPISEGKNQSWAWTFGNMLREIPQRAS